MIYCVRAVDVEADLDSKGFMPVEDSPKARIYKRPDGKAVTIRKPNDHGDIPEILVNDAYESAGVQVPTWDVHWCD